MEVVVGYRSCQELKIAIGSASSFFFSFFRNPGAQVVWVFLFVFVRSSYQVAGFNTCIRLPLITIRHHSFTITSEGAVPGS